MQTFREISQRSCRNGAIRCGRSAVRILFRSGKHFAHVIFITITYYHKKNELSIGNLYFFCKTYMVYLYKITPRFVRSGHYGPLPSMVFFCNFFLYLYQFECKSVGFMTFLGIFVEKIGLKNIRKSDIIRMTLETFDKK